jgi:hypothetical protein
MQRTEREGSRQTSSLRGRPSESLALVAPFGLHHSPTLFIDGLWWTASCEHKNRSPYQVNRIIQQRALFKAVLIRAIISEE